MPYIPIQEGDGTVSYIYVPDQPYETPPPSLPPPPPPELPGYAAQGIRDAIAGTGFTDSQPVTQQQSFSTPPPTTASAPSGAVSFKWVENPLGRWSTDGLVRQQVPSSDIQRYISQGWSEVEGPFSATDITPRGQSKGINIDRLGQRTEVNAPAPSATGQAPAGTSSKAGGNAFAPPVGAGPQDDADAILDAIRNQGGSGTLFQPPAGGTPNQNPYYGQTPDTGSYGQGGLQNPASPSGFIGPPTSLDLEETSPRAGFLRGLAQRGVDLGSIFGRTQSSNSRLSDYFNTWAFGNLLEGFQPQGSPLAGLSTGQPADANSFANFVRSQSGIGTVRQNAADSLGRLFGGSGFLQEQLSQPDAQQANALADLARTALMSRISPLALDLINLPQGADLRDRFLAEGQGGSFLDYFRSKFPVSPLGI